MVSTGNGSTNSNPSGQAKRRLRKRGWLVTGGTVGALVAAMGLTVLGLGATDNAVASFDASSWLWSAVKSEMARVNGVTARVDTRLRVPNAHGHAMQVSQTDRFLILRDLSTGQISSLDLATLQFTATMKSTAGLGVSVALHDDAAFVIDAVQGVVRQLDPRTLNPVGEPLRFPPGITGGFFDGDGRLWVAVPSEGTVTAIKPAPTSSKDGADGGGASPTSIRTITVAPPNNDLTLSALDDGVAVLNRTTNALTIVRDDKQRDIPLTMAGPGILPPRTSGDRVPVTIPDSREILVVADTGVQQLSVPGEGTRLSPAVAWAGRIYCADDATGEVYAFDANGTLVDTVTVSGANGPLELEVRENRLFINAPNSSAARVVDEHHTVRPVDKYANDILGGDPPQTPPPPPPPKKPAVSKPSAPRNVTASAGDARARVSWGPAAPNGAPILRYVVQGAGRTYEVGANQRSLEITGLTNGKTYRFSVHAVNAKGAGPARTSNPVVPTAEVPDPPESVTAKERPDGSVQVTWPAANGQGNQIVKYAVTAVSAGETTPVGESTSTELVIAPGVLEYGAQYAFTVVSITDKGAGSKSSPLSNTVVPFTVPGAPRQLSASTVAAEPGAIRVTWAAAVDNGRPITRYVVEANGRKVEVTDGTQVKLTGLGDGQTVTVRVHAVNEAGDGPAATATARTVAKPQVTITGTTADYTSVTVNFTVDAGGGDTQCTATISGATTAKGSCSKLTVSGLKASSSYTVTVSATNAAGTTTASRSVKTKDLYGVATCINGKSGDTATYCDHDVDGRNGNEIFSVTRQDNSKQVGWAKPGTRLLAYCKAQGEEVYAYIYNDHKRSTWWVQVDYKGRNYIPWAWLNLENGDDINALPTC